MLSHRSRRYRVDVSTEHRFQGVPQLCTWSQGSVHAAGQDIAAAIIAELPANTLAVDQRLTDLDAQIAATFDQHAQAAIIESMPYVAD